MRKNLKKLQIKGFVVGVLATVMLSATIIWANPGGVMREVFYGVNINLNGQIMQLADIDRPFIMDGRTFLPVRALSEALDIPVSWHGETRTVYVGKIPQGAPFFSTVPSFERSSNQFGLRTVNMMGNLYANALTRGENPWSGTEWSNHNLNGQFDTVTGTIGRIDGTSGANATISFIGDGRELASFTIDGSTSPIDISIDVSGVLVLRIQFSNDFRMGQGAPIRPAFANAMIE